ncbi:hypothetical protein PHMEG_00036724 [Phytophthora megakarya]|uniref:Uncharacterized protein n=1 Tax=Phytophthora megakarya TaxID=4795 RepID=A0A225UNS4_9STRA|nr:hypothetical protein PHMEG_00036724 [Phytophthora megakarya]
MASVSDADIMSVVQAGCHTIKNEFVPDEQMKARRRLLVENMQPPVRQAQILRLIDLERFDCKSDDVSFFDLIFEHAKVSLDVAGLSCQNGHEVGKPNRKPQRTPADKTSAPRAAPPVAAPSDGKNASIASSSRPALPSPPQHGCLECKGTHWLKDCPTTTDTQREETWKKYREAKERRLGIVRFKAPRYVAPNATVRLNGFLEVPYVPDTCADTNIIP